MGGGAIISTQIKRVNNPGTVKPNRNVTYHAGLTKMLFSSNCARAGGGPFVYFRKT